MSSLSITQEHGRVDANPASLKEAADSAVKEKDWVRAARMYTFAIDLLVQPGAGSYGSDSGEPSISDEKVLAENAHDWISLDKKSGGMLHILLSNRSYTHFKQEDWAAAAEDAEHCVQANPTFVKGHLRLLRALDEAEAPVEERVRVISRALRACPGSKPLTLAKKAIVKSHGASFEQAMEMDEERLSREQMETTKTIADNVNDPRNAMAAGDYGSALATGAFGVKKNVVEAEHYLRRGAEGGDMASAKNFGMLLLSLNRPAEASQFLRQAADAGDTEAAEVLKSLVQEADQKREEAMFKLRAMAQNGDERARNLLVRLEAEAKAASAETQQMPTLGRP